ncbi:MAG: hypothetical protein IPJ40_11965 [Saprospirales bacterium]|nr:hypothetical protein [Saprospirales bacterium]
MTTAMPSCAASDAHYGVNCRHPAGLCECRGGRISRQNHFHPGPTNSTRKAPRAFCPADNVSICLCSIECNRGLPIAEGCTDFACDVDERRSSPNNLDDLGTMWCNSAATSVRFPTGLPGNPTCSFSRITACACFSSSGSGHDRSEFSDRAPILSRPSWDGIPGRCRFHFAGFRLGYYGPAQPLSRHTLMN